MIKESRYILRRILIGVGIVLVLGFIRSNKAHALSWSDRDMEELISFKVRSSDTNYNYIYYNSTDDRYYIKLSFSPNDYSYYIENASDFPYFICYDYTTHDGTSWATNIGSSSNEVSYCQFSDKELKYLWYGDYGGGNNQRFWVSDSSFNYKEILVRYNSTFSINSGSRSVSSHTINNNSLQYAQLNSTNVRRNSVFASNYNILNFSSGELYYEKNIDWPSSISQILSIEDDIEQDSGYVYRVYLIPHYSNFNPDLYSYEFKIGKDGVWEDGLLDGAGIPFTINGNVYFRVVDKSNNNVVDSATYTISEISKVYQGSSSSVDYNIDINATYNTLSVSNQINKVFLNVSFTPAYTSFIKYYYKFGSGDWVEIEEEEFTGNTWTYITNVNGNFYVKMEDLNGNILFDKIYEVNEIGKLGFMVNDSNMNNYFTSLSNKIGFGGPISSLINVPIRVLSVIGDSFSSGATCTNYSLGSLWGTNLVLPCVNVKQHLGNTLYTTIDLILSGVMIYTIFMWLCSMYDKFMNLDRDPAGDISRLGRW